MCVRSHQAEPWLTAGRSMKEKQAAQEGFVLARMACLCIWSLPPRSDCVCVYTPVWYSGSSHSQSGLCVCVCVCAHLVVTYVWEWAGETDDWADDTALSFTPAAMSQREDQLFKSFISGLSISMRLHRCTWAISSGLYANLVLWITLIHILILRVKVSCRDTCRFVFYTSIQHS